VINIVFSDVVFNFEFKFMGLILIMFMLVFYHQLRIII